MSTEHQKYSTENQAEIIAQYAARRGFEIVKTYEDSGKSGLRLDGRLSLQQLIADVRGGQTDFKAILVYDVSRWGRFQDADESAYYEFICREAGITVQYCAEQFENDGSLRQTELRLGRARLGDTRAKALYNAARRASAETLQQRLDRVIPLMSELYRRLRPHPLWGDIEYSVRGDVNRFLTLKVGGDVNPQFVFSSGQRRATGLAFLLSVNLSIAWSRWQSILLDDPVQHVDDFRTVHLAEVLAQLCSSGRQIVCAVEDRALADLMCRRLPSSVASPGKRISLGTDASGALAVVHEQTIATLSRRSLVLPDEPLSA